MTLREFALLPPLHLAIHVHSNCRTLRRETFIVCYAEETENLINYMNERSYR
jgi:hypothetical protein